MVATNQASTRPPGGAEQTTLLRQREGRNARRKIATGTVLRERLRELPRRSERGEQFSLGGAGGKESGKHLLPGRGDIWKMLRAYIPSRARSWHSGCCWVGGWMDRRTGIPGRRHRWAEAQRGKTWTANRSEELFGLAVRWRLLHCVFAGSFLLFCLLVNLFSFELCHCEDSNMKSQIVKAFSMLIL